jgi:hypothetical protein
MLSAHCHWRGAKTIGGENASSARACVKRQHKKIFAAGFANVGFGKSQTYTTHRAQLRGCQRREIDRHEITFNLRVGALWLCSAESGKIMAWKNSWVLRMRRMAYVSNALWRFVHSTSHGPPRFNEIGRMMRVLDYQSGIADILQISEVPALDDACKDLFRRLFNAPAPDTPRHFVAHYGPSFDIVAGYVHFTPFDDVYLGGGMGLDARLYRQMSKEHRQRISDAGGIIEVLLRASFIELADKDAVFGYCGDTKAMRVDLRAGFVPTEYPHLIVFWPRTLTRDRQAELIGKAHAVGPF